MRGHCGVTVEKFKHSLHPKIQTISKLSIAMFEQVFSTFAGLCDLAITRKAE